MQYIDTKKNEHCCNTHECVVIRPLGKVDVKEFGSYNCAVQQLYIAVEDHSNWSRVDQRLS